MIYTVAGLDVGAFFFVAVMTVLFAFFAGLLLWLVFHRW